MTSYCCLPARRDSAGWDLTVTFRDTEHFKVISVVKKFLPTERQANSRNPASHATGDQRRDFRIYGEPCNAGTRTVALI